MYSCIVSLRSLFLLCFFSVYSIAFSIVEQDSCFAAISDSERKNSQKLNENETVKKIDTKKLSEVLNDNNNSSVPLLPTDTIPLGVDQFMAPSSIPELKGPVGEFVSVSREFIPGKACKDSFAVRIKIRNETDNPIIVDASKAKALLGQSTNMCLSEEVAMKLSGQTFTKEQKKILASTALLSFGFAEPLLQDHFSTSKKDFPVSYGINETRRRLEDRIFSSRLILPGEDSEGVVYFAGDKFDFDKITIPVYTYPDLKVSGIINVNKPLSGLGKIEEFSPNSTPNLMLIPDKRLTKPAKSYGARLKE